jgi:hypothetical protein
MGFLKSFAQIAFWIILGGLFLYLFSSLIVFDFFETAFPGDEDNTTDGRPVAIGPKPRAIFCRPTVHDVRFEGDEWPFKVYAPICSAWRLIRGYEPPAEERTKRSP